MFQDWTDVVITKKKPAAGTTMSADAARRAGAQVESVKKFAAGSNSHGGGASAKAAKLDAETGDGELSHAKVSTELKTNIMKARLEKKMTQAQLAQARPGTLRVGLANAERTQMINELPKVVQDYEAGKAMPNQQIITKMERALGVPLRPKKK